MQHEPLDFLQAAAPAGPRLAALAQHAGPASAFWSLFLQAVVNEFSARRALLMVRSERHPWQAFAQWPLEAPDAPGEAERLLQLAGQAQHASTACADRPDLPGMIAVRLAASPLAGDTVLAICLQQPAERDGWRSLAELAALVPLQYLRGIAPDDPSAALAGAHRMHDILQLVMRIGEEPHFLQMALALCNDLAVRYRCERVSLGWVEHGYVKLAAVSHIEKFDRKSSAARDLELAMEEAMAQECELRWPEPERMGQVTRAHEAYVRSHGGLCIASLPLRLHDRVVGVLAIERREAQLA